MLIPPTQLTIRGESQLSADYRSILVAPEGIITHSAIGSTHTYLYSAPCQLVFNEVKVRIRIHIEIERCATTNQQPHVSISAHS